jgi:large subunit ribosomal protein L46
MLTYFIQAADRILIEAAGDRMNSFIVGNHPVGHIPMPYSSSAVTRNEIGHAVKGDMVFFMKGRIMAGRVDFDQAMLGYKDYRWLAKEEIQDLVHKRYWSWIRHMLSDR